METENIRQRKLPEFFHMPERSIRYACFSS